jgi:glycosyltransferase involved in cell wall biosynthesis
MRIAVEATSWHNQRGYGRHARALLSTLVRLDIDNRYTFFFDSRANLGQIPEEMEVRYVRAGSPASEAASANGHRSLIDMWRMSHALSSPDYDVLLFPTVYSYVPVLSRAKKVVMIHDVIPEKFPKLTFPHPTARILWKTKSALGRWQADAIVTVSEYSRKGIMECFDIPAERVAVVGEASDPVFQPLDNPQITPRLLSLGVPENGRLVVYVGGFGPHKNVQSLVAAFASLAKLPAFSDTYLILVGEYKKEVFHSDFSRIKDQIDLLGISDRVLFTGYLPDIELVVLLNLSAVLVLPSFIEGFGLPAVEAAACGCPVIATKSSPLPELLKGGGIYIDPNRPKELGFALRRVLESDVQRRKMREAGLAAAGALTWENAAFQLKDLINEMALL